MQVIAFESHCGNQSCWEEADGSLVNAEGKEQVINSAEGLRSPPLHCHRGHSRGEGRSVVSWQWFADTELEETVTC